MRNVLLVAALLGGLLSYLGAKFLGYTRHVTYNDEKCVLVPNISPGSEDIAIVDKTLALVSAGDLDRMLFKSGKPARKGAIFALWLDDDVYAERILMENYPKGRSFNPHGIHFSKSTGRVYAVNHECGEMVLEAIEMFVLVRDNDDNKKVRLVYERSIESSSFPLGGLNDVTEGAFHGELYVTEWLRRPSSAKCGVTGLMDFILRIIDAHFLKGTKLYRCEFDPKASTPEPISCTVAADGFNMPNGITVDPDKKHIYVVDSTADELRIYARNSEGSLSLKNKIQAGIQGPDNVEYDPVSGKLTLSSLPLLYQAIGRLDGDDSIKVSGGMVTVEPLQNGTYIVEQVLMHDGSKLSFITSAVLTDGRILLGSAASDGVLVCPIPSQPLSRYFV